MKGYRAWNPRQMSLLPLDPMEWLPETHLVHLLLDVVEELDLSAIESAIQAKDHRGKRPFPPRMMVGLLLYGYCVRTFSSRKLELATHENLGFRVLCGGNHPDHCTINTFRKTHLAQLSELFLQVLRMCQEAGLVKLGHVALDGTKMQGNASKHKAMSYSVMKRKEEELAAEIEELLKNAEAVDAAEDEKYGKDKRGDELPEELHRRESRRQKIREAREVLEAQAARAHAEHKRKLAEKSAREAATSDADKREAVERRSARNEEKAQESASRAVEKAEQRVENSIEKAASLRSNAQTHAESCAAAAACQKMEAAQRDLEKAKTIQASNEPDAEESVLPEHRVPFDKHGNPTPKAQLNFTDPDSKIMKAGDGYLQGYNCQAAVDEESQIIVAQAATNQVAISCQ
jgi:transposase